MPSLSNRSVATPAGGSVRLDRGIRIIMEEYLAGTRLYGDDFSDEEIAKWYEDEREAYAELRGQHRPSGPYEYHYLNWLHGFRFIDRRRFRAALGLGSAFGDEFRPIAGRIGHITIVEPSDAFRMTDVDGVPCDYLKPSVDGLMPFEDESFDLAMCLGVLHHISNVTTVVREVYRCLAQDGYLLLREPIVSLGDWSQSRPGMTRRERGIPLDILNGIVADAGFHTISRRFCVFPVVPRACRRFGICAYNNRVVTRIDALLCWLFQRNVRYHATHFLHKLRPVSVYSVLTKRRQPEAVVNLQ